MCCKSNSFHPNHPSLVFLLLLSVSQKAIRVTTFMQRLKNSEALIDSSAEVQGSEEAGDGEGGASQGTSDEGEKGMSDGGVTSSSVSLEVTIESMPSGMDQSKETVKAGEKQEEVKMHIGPSVGTSPSGVEDLFCQPNAVPNCTQEQPDKVGAKKGAGEGTRKMAANLGQNKVVPELKQTPAVSPEASKLLDSTSGINLDKKHISSSPDPSSKRKMAATLHAPSHTASAAASASPLKRPVTQSEQKDETDGSWCQTQVPEAVAEKSVVAPVTPAVGPGTGVDGGLEVRLRGDESPVDRQDRNARRTDRYSAEFSIPRAGATPGQACYAVGSSASLGRHATPYNPEVGAMGMGMAGSYGSPYSSLYTSGGGVGRYGTGLQHSGGTSSDWQMDSVIEQIEKQMAAVLEKIEGDMPSLLEQISDCPAEQPRARSTHASPATSRARPSQRSTSATTGTPPPLPTSPRPVLPSLPHISIPPPAYPPPSPPTEASPQALGEQEDRDGQAAPAHSSQSPRPGIGRGL